MRIWIINHYAVPSGGKNASRHAVLAKYLQQAGHEVTIFAASLAHGNHQRSHTIPFAPNADFLDEHRDGALWRFIRAKPYRNNLQRLWQMRDFCRKVLQSLEGLPKPDVVVGSCVHPYAVEAARQIGRRLSIPFVYEIRDIWPESLADVGGMSRWHPVYQLFRRMELNALRDADGVITLLPGMHDYLERHAIAADRICYLPNGIDPDAFRQIEEPTERAQFVFSYFGAHGPANGLENLVDAADILQREYADPIQIQLVGDGAAKPTLVDRATSLKLDNLCFRPPRAKAELNQLAAASDGFIFNLKRMPIIERYGLSANKLFEYMINARPIVFACSSYNDPVAEAGAGVSIPPEDPRALAEALVRMVRTDRQARREMGRRGRAYALSHHDLAQLAGQLVDFLDRSVPHRVTPTTKVAA